MRTPLAASQPTLNIDSDYRRLVDARFVERTWSENLPFISGAAWLTEASLDDAPGERLAKAAYFHSTQEELLVRLDGGVAHLILTGRSLVVRGAAASERGLEKLHHLVRAALPEAGADDLEVPIRLWWWQSGHAMDLARMLAVEPWAKVAANYTADARRRLAPLAAWEAPPAGGRLILWHGEPGTGKTSAVRSMAGAWRDWADFQFITDPEQFLQQPGYLLNAVMPQRRRSSGPTTSDRWRVVVLEDAGEFLVADAKHLQGQALSRLLNVCDGVLGQAMRALIIITTNEPAHHLHPAIVRPGRCLAEVAFAPLSYDEAHEWCNARGSAPPAGPGSWTVAQLYAHVEDRARPADREVAFGFAGAGANGAR